MGAEEVVRSLAIYGGKMEICIGEETVNSGNLAHISEDCKSQLSRSSGSGMRRIRSYEKRLWHENASERYGSPLGRRTIGRSSHAEHNAHRRSGKCSCHSHQTCQTPVSRTPKSAHLNVEAIPTSGQRQENERHSRKSACRKVSHHHS